MTRAIRIDELTPNARKDAGVRSILEGVRLLVSAELAEQNAGAEWIDQAHSPLGRRRHCELARTGVLPAAKEGRRVLIRRSDINAYLDTKQPRRLSTDEDDESVDAVLRRLGAK